MAEPSPGPIIAVERRTYIIQFGGLALAAGAQITGVSGGITFRYRVRKAKVFFLDDCVPDLRYYVLVGSTPGGSTTGVPEGDNVFAPLSSVGFIRGSQGPRICEPMLIVDAERSYIKVHVFNGDAVYACNWAAEVEIERLV